jgi:coenzyme F420-reducing hydrogenase alpha subunit
MNKEIVLKKATRIEGNANIYIEVEDGHVKAARFVVQEFRGFERFMQGRRVEFVPQLISRICGLCCTAHQVASLKAIEDALAIEVPPSVDALREIAVLGEWISSHALSYFFLTMPDFVGVSGGVLELMDSQPEITGEAFALRKAGLRIVEVLGKRAVHPLAMGVGRFLVPPTAADLNEVRGIAAEVKDRTARLITQLDKTHHPQKRIVFPQDQQVNLLVYDGRGRNMFRAYSKRGRVTAEFSRDEFEDNISEMRAEWTFAKFPYLTRYGFPEGIMLVGPLSRSFKEGGVLDDPELVNFDLTEQVRDRALLSLESFDTCRLLEIFWAAKRVLTLVDEVDLSRLSTEVDPEVSGQGFGVLEAPRGVLMHSYLVNRGCIERMRLLVATQFNNAFINLLIKDLAERHLKDNSLSQEGERLIGRCIRIFDPCLSCATH